MPSPSVPDAVLEATSGFVARLPQDAVHRVQVKASGPAGMHLLCAVEGVIAAGLPRRPLRELVWLTAGPAEGHRLTVQAFGPSGAMVA